MDTVLSRHPQLKLILAHFYFLSADLERAGCFLNTHPTVCFDLAPHIEMYHDFSNAPGVAKAFFLRYQDRILYGSDIDTRALARGAQALMRFIPWLIRSMLEKEGSLATPDGKRYTGLGLSHEVLEKIYHINFERIYGNQPASLRTDQS